MIRRQPRKVTIPFVGGPHDGEVFRASADPESRPVEVARSHRTGAGPVRSRYALAHSPTREDPDRWIYVFVRFSEESLP